MLKEFTFGNFAIVRSITVDGQVGWAIITSHNTFLIDPTTELRKFTQSDQCIEIWSDTKVELPSLYKYDDFTIVHGCLRYRSYVLIRSPETVILFPMKVDQPVDLIQKFHPKIILTLDGEIERPAQTMVRSLLE